MKNIKLIALMIIGAVIVSCQSNTYEEVSKVTNPTYAKNIQPLMASKCISCHSASTISQYPTLDSYQEVKDAIINDNLLCRIDGTCGNLMPPGQKMPQSSVEMVQVWKNNGYKN